MTENSEKINKTDLDVDSEKETYFYKSKDENNCKYGINPYERELKELLNKGVVILDKDDGHTSHEEMDYLKKILNIQKAGHSGTLDPKVTGVLVSGLGKATRLMEYMLYSDKEYVCLMYVHKKITREQILTTFKRFTGKIKQMPPVISAVKREERVREIYSIKLLDFKDGQNVLFRVRSERGTYIRKLCSDMGEFMKTGAHMKELRRTKAGPFTENDSIISLDKLRNLYELYQESKEKQLETETELFEKELRKYILPMEEIVKDFKKVFVKSSAVSYIARGSNLALPGVIKFSKDIEIGDIVILLTSKEELIGIGLASLDSKTALNKKKGIFVNIKKILMDPDYYPKKWEELD